MKEIGFGVLCFSVVFILSVFVFARIIEVSFLFYRFVGTMGPKW